MSNIAKRMSGWDLKNELKNEKYLGSVTDEHGNPQWWDTIDESREYEVFKWNKKRQPDDCEYVFYQIKKF